MRYIACLITSFFLWLINSPALASEQQVYLLGNSSFMHTILSSSSVSALNKVILGTDGQQNHQNQEPAFFGFSHTVYLPSLTSSHLHHIIADFKAILGDHFNPAQTFILVLKQKVSGQLIAAGIPIEHMQEFLSQYHQNRQGRYGCKHSLEDENHLNMADLQWLASYLQRPDVSGKLFPPWQQIKTQILSPDQWCCKTDDTGCQRHFSGDPIESILQQQQGELEPVLYYGAVDQHSAKTVYLPELLSEYEKQLEDEMDLNQLRKVIARYTRWLVLLHPFQDGNHRTFLKLADQILDAYGLPGISEATLYPLASHPKAWDNQFAEVHQQMMSGYPAPQDEL